MVISFANAAQNSRAVSREQLLSRSSCGSRVQLKSGLRFLRPFGVFKSDLRMQGRGRCRTGVARGGVHDDARVFVIAHEGRVGDLAGEVVHDGQIFIGGIKLGVDGSQLSLDLRVGGHCGKSIQDFIAGKLSGSSAG